MGEIAKRVTHILASSAGGIRRHVRFLAENPPPGYSTAGVWGPRELEPYFDALPFRAGAPIRAIVAPPRTDVVHAHGFEAGVVALRPSRPPVVLTVHTDLMTQGRTARSGALRSLARLVAARADAVIAVSPGAARHFRQARVIAPASPTLGPPSRTREDVRRELGTATDTVVVVTVARLHRDKGLDAFIRAVHASGAEGWICGDGPQRAELETIATGTRVRLLGHRDDIAEILAAADVFALPSVGEAYGIAVSEAIAAGLPVVVSDAGAMREIAGDAGLVVPPGDVDRFSAALRSLVTDANRRGDLAARARSTGGPDPRELVARVGHVYDEVVG